MPWAIDPQQIPALQTRVPQPVLKGAKALVVGAIYGRRRVSASGRVERRRDRFRPMASFVSALSSIVANSLQVMPTFPPPPLLIPYSGFSRIRLEASPSCGTLPLGFSKRLIFALAVHAVFGLSYPILWYGSDAHRPLAQHGLSCPRLQTLLRPDAPV